MASPDPVPDPGDIRRVVLLHGIWNAPFWLAPLVRLLRRQGFEPEVWGYDSVLGGPGRAVPALVERLRGGPPTHLVGHSLGGLIALEALRRAPDLPVGRVVCLGSPLRGSRTARALRARGWGGPVLGRSGRMLLRGVRPWRGRVEVGVVAGGRPRGLGRLLGAVGLDSDGTVALAETRLEGVRDHCVVPASHTGLVLSAEAARQAARFLRSGRFAHGEAAQNV